MPIATSAVGPVPAPRRPWRAAALLVATLLASGAAYAGEGISDRGAATLMALRFFDDNPHARGSALAVSAHAELERAAGVSLVARGRDADGAFLFGFVHPAGTLAARGALNRLRATGALVYAALVDEAHADAAARRLPVQVQTSAPPGTTTTSILVTLRAPADRQRKAGRIDSATLQEFMPGTGVDITDTRVLTGESRLMQLSAALPMHEAGALLERLRLHPDVAHVEIDRRARVQAMPSDPMFASQWNLSEPQGGINAPAAWDITTGDASAPIAVLDTGVLPHPELAGRTIGGYDFISDPRFSNDGDGRDADPFDAGDYVTAAESSDASSVLSGCAVSNSTWHGTMVNGTLGAAANNASGLTGIVWKNPLLNVRVLGKCGGALSDIVDGMRWAVGLPVTGVPANPTPARVVNLSFAGTGPCGPVLQGAITEALSRGAVAIAAAGNDNGDVGQHWPANCNGVIAVAATSRDGSRAYYSNVGNGIALSAPGGGSDGGIPTLSHAATTSADAFGHTYGMQVGSSLAAPLVSGLAALALSLDAELAPAEIQALMETTARAFPRVSHDACTPAACGAGIADAAATLGVLRNGHPAAPTPVPVHEAPAPQAPTPSPPPLVRSPSDAPEAAPAPSEVPPPSGRVKVPGGWRAKSPSLVERLVKPAMD